jgi:hypothetical protein
LEVGVENFTQLGGDGDFLHPSVWSYASGIMRFRDASDKGTA